MRTVEIQIGDSDIETLKSIFKNEPDFKPQSNEDRLIIALMRQILDNAENNNEGPLPLTLSQDGKRYINY